MQTYMIRSWYTTLAKGMGVGVCIFLFALYVVPIEVTYSAGELVTCSGDSCRACDLAALVLTVGAFLRNLGAMIATLIFMWAGFKLVTSGGNTEARSNAKNVLVNVAIGVVLMTAAFLIVNTIMQVLVGDAFFGGAKWYTVQCVANPSTTARPTGTFNSNPTVVNGKPLSTVSLGTAGQVTSADEAAVRQALQNSGVTFNPSITPVGVSAAKLEEIANNVQACRAATGQACGVIITSGLRTLGNLAGVGAHGSGLAVDVVGTGGFDNWMRSQSGHQQIVSFKGLTGFQSPSTGTKCTWEPKDSHSTGDHWHCQ